MKLRATVKIKMISTIAVVTVCLGAIAACTVMQMMERTISDMALHHIKTVAEQQEAIIGRIVTDSLSFAEHLGSQQPVIGYLQQPEQKKQRTELLSYIAGLDASNKYQAIYIMDMAGNVLFSTDSSLVGQNYEFRAYFKDALAGKSTMDVVIGGISNKFGYYFASPVKAKSGDIVGVVATKLNEGLIANALHPKGLNIEGDAMLVDKYGVVFQANRPELLFKSLGVLTPEAYRAVEDTKRFSGINIVSLQYDRVAEEIAGLREPKGLVLYNRLHDHDELIGVARIADTQFFIVITEVRQFFAQSAGNMEINIGLLVFMVSIVTVLALILLTTPLLRPLYSLRDTSLRMEKGNFAQQATVETGDEFGDVAKALNATMEQIKKTNGITEGKLWERAADFEKFKLAVESASDHIIITDVDGRILHANKAAEAITGYSHTEMIGSRPSLWGKQMSEEFYRNMWATIKDQRKVFYGEMTNQRKNGALYTAEVHIAPLLTDKGDLCGFVGIERDITAQKNADRAKTDFASVVSHQLRTPLAAISWYVEMLSNEDVGVVNEAQRKYLDRIHAASTRMVDLVGSLLSASHIDMGTPYVEPEPIPLPDIADSVIDELRRFVEKKHMTINRIYDPQLGQVDVDPNMMRVVFQNILSNAIKYTSENGLVTITLKREGENALITVSDTGYGIPADQQSRIFTKFFRADNARKKEPEGNGLGLYITKSIINNAQGTIGFTSEEGKGSEFRIFIPLAGIKKESESKQIPA